MGTNWLSIQGDHVLSAHKNNARTCFSTSGNAKAQDDYEYAMELPELST